MLENIISKEAIPADGVQRQWDIPFTFYKLADVGFYVSYDNGKTIEKITQNIRYEKDGNYFVYPTEESKLPVLPVGATVLLLRETENKQLETSETLPFNSKDIERMADNLTMQIQDLKRDSLRSVKSSLFSEETGEEFAERFFEKADEAIESASKAQKSADDAERSNQESLLNAQNAASSAVLAASASESAREHANAAKNDADRAEAAKLNNEEVLAAAEAFAARSENASEESKKHSEDAKQSVVDAEQFAIAAAASAESAKNAADLAEELIKDLDAGVYTKEEIDNKVIVIEADIDAQADAIQKTRSDFMESDSELQQQINAHANELTTIKNDIDDLGDQVAGIESKIPEGTSDTNPLINKQQLLDEEMDIRSDFNESVSELQTQITAQASAIANKVDVTGDTMTGALNLPELNVANSEGTLNLSITAGVATIATNNGLDIVSQTKFDTAPTTDDSTTWADALDTSLVRKAQVVAAIAAGGGGGSVPDNVYTSDNLIAGKNVTFTEVPPEGGIDSHTKALWHFDEDKIDVIGGISCPNNIYASQYKFGTGSIRPNKTSTTKTDISSLGLDSTKEVTVDFWFKPYSASNTEVVGLCATPTDGLLLRIGATVSLSGAYWTDGDGTVVVSGLDVANWYHCGFVYDPSSKIVSIFIDGEKKGTYGVTGTPSFTAFALYGGASYPYVDELRISDIIRYTSNFTPLNEAYTVATGPSKTAIDVELPEVDIPEGIYTQTNLLGGKDIEIVPEPVEGGIDEHTLACWHFDGNQIDEVSGQSFSGNNYTYQIGKFGNSLYKGSSDNYVTSRNLLSSLNPHTMEEFTIDFWFSFDSSSSYAIACTGNNTTNPSGKIYYMKITPYKINLWDTYSGPDVANSYAFPSTLGYGPYYHIVIQVKHFIAKVFFEGEEVLSADFTSAGLSADKTGFKISGFVSKIDELRISDIARYTEDFTPPTQPYRIAEPTGNMVVNFVGEKLQKGADYVIESYNDGTNWYRVYKSGWIEQGGSASTIAIITLLKPMKDTNYTVIGMQNGTTPPSNTEGSPRAGAISTTQIFVAGGANVQNVNYYVCGQADPSVNVGAPDDSGDAGSGDDEYNDW